jgi:FtsP/CotA-like multicopper oxidase with cupredoxin domain
MWHCHFEPVEHIQMGMVGPLLVRPAQDGNDGGGDPFKGKYAYNDGDGSTEYDREFAIFVSELDSRPHELLPNVQEFEWTEYKPDYWLLNGRAYPQTLLPNGEPSLPLQPVSSLIRANAGDRVLLRIVNLGYEQHALQLPGIGMKVVGKDAKLLRGPDGADLTYWANTLYVKPGETYDAIFTAPSVTSETTYRLHNRNYNKMTNAGSVELGGMVTEVRVFPGTLPPQKGPNE